MLAAPRRDGLKLTADAGKECHEENYRKDRENETDVQAQ